MGLMSRHYAFTGHCLSRVADNVIHNPYTLRALTGVMVQYCLGCGANGCAFRAERSLVLKVGTHEGESPIAEIIKGHGRIWPFLPVFYGSWIVPGRMIGRDGEIGITLREDLDDFSPDHPKKFIDEATTLLESAVRARSPEMIQTLRRRLGSVIEDMTSVDARALKMLADFALWSKHYRLGFDLREFSGSLAITNLGQSLDDTAIVIRDIGNFEPKRGALEHLRRATLQRVRDKKAER